LKRFACFGNWCVVIYWKGLHFFNIYYFNHSKSRINFLIHRRKIKFLIVYWKKHAFIILRIIASCSSGVWGFVSFYCSQFDSLCVHLSSSRCLTCLLGFQSVQWAVEIVMVRANWPGHPTLIKKRRRIIHTCVCVCIYIKVNTNPSWNCKFERKM